MALPAVVLGALILAPAAWAATRYAEPGGDGPATSCPEANPCSLAAAIGDPSVRDGDEVVVLPGVYEASGTIGTVRAIRVHGNPGAPPTIQLSGTGSHVTVNNPGATFSDLTIIGPPRATTGGSASTLFVPAGVVERVQVIGDDGFFACEVDSARATPALIRDSICWSRNQASLAGAGTYGPGGGGFAGDYLARFVNVTAIGVEKGLAIWALSGGTAAIEATNVIARNDPSLAVGAERGDVVAETAPPSVFATPAGAAATITLSNSNYATTGAFGPSSSVTAAGSGSNRTAAPRLANPAAGDFRQVSGSPTIDAGAAVPLLGSLDFEGQARVQGAAADVGADEGSIPAPFRLSAEQRQRLRDLGLSVQCRLPACSILVQGVIAIKTSGGSRAVTRASKQVLLKTRRVELTSGERGSVDLEPLSHAATVKRALARGAKVTAKVEISTGAAGVQDRARIRVLP